MKVSFKATDAHDALSTLVNVTGAAEHVTVTASKGKLTFSATNKGYTMRIWIEAKVEQKGGFTCFPYIALNTLARRAHMDWEAENENKLIFSSGKYKGDFGILPYEEISLEEPEGTDIELRGESLKFINKLVGAVEIKPAVGDGKEMLPVILKLSEKGVEAACFDDLHIMYARSTQVTHSEDQMVCLPSQTLSTVAKLAEDEEYRLVLCEAQVFAEGSNFQLVMPVAQMNADITMFEDARSIIRDADKADATQVIVERSNLEIILDNVLGVAEADLPLIFTVGKEIKVGTKSNTGSAFDFLEGEIEGGKASLQTGIYPAVEILTKFNTPQLTLRLIPERFLMAKEETTTMKVWGIVGVTGD